MIILFTDFGGQSPYVGQMKLAMQPYAPAMPIFDLCHDVNPYDVQAAAYLLAAFSQDLPKDCTIVGVVDPGVGGPRKGLIVRADNRHYIGPDNGLFDRIIARAERYDAWQILWRSARVSATFHGRDIFGPVAAMLAQATATPDELGDPMDLQPREWPDDLARIVYIDHYGNAMTGIRASSMGNANLRAQGQTLQRMQTFSDAAEGAGFWYENSSGLAEIAVNQGRADAHYGLSVGDVVEVVGDASTEIRVR